MRKLLAGGAAIVVCLTLGGAPALAQSDAVVVTATQECDTTASPIACTYTASDPRVAGSGGHEFVGGAFRDDQFVVPGSAAALYWTDAWIEGPEGNWTGHHYIIVDEAGVAFALMMLTGEGAYDGWSYVASGTDPEADANHDLVGVIYQGPLPPVGSVPVPAGD